jgi:predicted Rossmann fold nucleotide-binding protein DprA/Smf involved in DNA uptake
MILAIIGSRDFSDFELLELTVNGIEDVSEIISGGAKGTDSLARDYASQQPMS